MKNLNLLIARLLAFGIWSEAKGLIFASLLPEDMQVLEWFLPMAAVLYLSELLKVHFASSRVALKHLWL